MDTKKLSILLATIQAGSLKKAAEKLNYTQSGLIYLVNSLEEEIGGQLKAGFLLKDLYEDRDREGCGILREYTPQYVATWSVKK